MYVIVVVSLRVRILHISKNKHVLFLSIVESLKQVWDMIRSVWRDSVLKPYVWINMSLNQVWDKIRSVWRDSVLKPYVLNNMSLNNMSLNNKIQHVLKQ